MLSAFRELLGVEERNYEFDLEQRQEHTRQHLDQNDRDLAALQIARLSEKTGTQWQNEKHLWTTFCRSSRLTTSWCLASCEFYPSFGIFCIYS